MSALPKLAAPAQRALASAGVTNLKQLTKLTEADLLQLHGMGKNAIATLRAALAAQGLSFRKQKDSRVDKTADQIKQYMDALDHPLKKGVEQIRKLIKSVHTDIEEQIKWNAPSYSYRGEYLLTFNLRANHHIHLVFHNPKIAQVKSKILEGDYKDRRMAYFTSLDDIKTKTPALTKAIKDLIKLQGH